MNTVSVGQQRYSLKGQYDFDKVVNLLNISFKKNLKFALIGQGYLNFFSMEMICQQANQLVQQYKNGKYGQIYVRKINHVIDTLELFKKGKFNLYLRNLKEAHQFNHHYAQDGKQKLIQGLPELIKDYNCQICNSASFFDKSSLGSHQKACLKKQNNKKIQFKIDAPIQRVIKKVIGIKNSVQLKKIDQKVQIDNSIDEEQKNYYTPKVMKINGQKRTKDFNDEYDSDRDEIYGEESN